MSTSSLLAKKLGIKTGNNVLLVNTPSHYFTLFEDFPKDITIVKAAHPEELDFIHLFVESIEEFEDRFIHLKPMLQKSGMIWISWPKGESSIHTNLNRDLIREFGLGIGLVDVKVCSIDSDWSALKFVYRLKDR